MKIPKLMLITDGSLEKNARAFARIVSFCRYGLLSIQLREKTIEDRNLWNLAGKFRKITQESGVFFSINDRVDIAFATQADGVHLSENGLSPQIPKTLFPSLLVGVSVHSIEKGRQAEQEGADYVLFGPIFKTPSKTATILPQGLQNLEKIVRQLTIPVLAVGGITPLETRECINAGAYGVAAIRAFMHSQNREETMKGFLREIL